MRNCWFHDYTKWTQEEKKMKHLLTNKKTMKSIETPYVENYQFRTCNVCGYYQEEVIE